MDKIIIKGVNEISQNWNNIFIDNKFEADLELIRKELI